MKTLYLSTVFIREVVVRVSMSEGQTLLHLFILFIFPSGTLGDNKLLMAVKMGVMHQTFTSLLFVPPPTCPPPYLSLSPWVLAGSQHFWLRFSFTVCQQISGERMGGLLRKVFGPKLLLPFFLFINFIVLSPLCCSCSHNAAAAGAVAASINIVLMFWWLEPAR